MNYFYLINAFYDTLEENPLNSSEIALWHALANIANKAGWPKDFTRAISALSAKSGLDVRTLTRTRNQLQQKGYINWKSRGGSQSATYQIIDLCKSNDENGVQQPVQLYVQQSVQQSVHINKQELKHKQDTILHGAEAPCESVMQIILNDKSYHPVTQEQVDRWHELYPAVDIMAQLRAMVGWCEANNTKRKTKTGINKFINSWLAREQNKGGTISENKQGRRTLNG